MAAKKIRKLSLKEIRRLRNEKGRITLCDVPSLAEVAILKNPRLRMIIRYCPYSDDFGITDKKLLRKFPKKRQVQQFVSKMTIEWSKSRRGLITVDEQSVEESPAANLLNQAQIASIAE